MPKCPAADPCLSMKEKGDFDVRSLHHRPSKIFAPIFERPFDSSNRSLISIKPNWSRKVIPMRMRTNMLRRGFATGCVCARAGGLMLRKQITNRVKGGPIAPQADMTMGVKILLFPASSSDFQDDPRPGEWIEVDHVSIVGSSVCCRKPCLHNCGIGDTVLHHQVRKYIADRVVWS